MSSRLPPESGQAGQDMLGRQAQQRQLTLTGTPEALRARSSALPEGSRVWLQEASTVEALLTISGVDL